MRKYSRHSNLIANRIDAHTRIYLKILRRRADWDHCFIYYISYLPPLQAVALQAVLLFSTVHNMSSDDKSLRDTSVASHDGIPGSKLELSNPASDNEDPEKGVEQQRTVFNPRDWNGPDDPQNPLNWPVWIRYCHIIPVAFICFAA
jgi:hypothetical protein